MIYIKKILVLKELSSCKSVGGEGRGEAEKEDGWEGERDAERERDKEKEKERGRVDRDVVSAVETQEGHSLHRTQ